MDSKKVVMWVAGVVAAIGLGVLLFSPAGGGGQDISPERAAELVAEGVRVIDVRTPGEYGASHIAGAENVPMNALRQEMAGWDPSAPLLIYCATGERSSDAMRYLSDAGFETVYHLAAGIIAWQGEVARGAGAAESPSAGAPDQTPGDAPVLLVFSTDW